MTPKLIVIDDDPEIASLVRDVAEQSGFSAVSLTDADALFEPGERTEPDVIVLDLVMPTTDGIEMIRRLSQERCKARLILMTGYRETYLNLAMSLAEALGIETIGRILKPAPIAEMEAVFAQAKQRLAGRNLDNRAPSMVAR